MISATFTRRPVATNEVIYLYSAQCTERQARKLENAVNTKMMEDAQAHPERHRQLVVRIWGWSAYFVELDKEYQDHVMRRQQYRV